ncbi:MAG: hypothetical protein V2J12_06740 [Gammaproteobacteria bacterium]|jgi:hypothetical protein|nr:hypothetical protein [Gammaproteobacteria bacterium]
MSARAPAPSYWIVVAGLVALGVVLPLWLRAAAPGWGWTGALGGGIVAPAALLFAVLTRSRNWSGITALAMIPFASIGVMDLVANLRQFDSGMALAVVAIAVFFAALDAGRREPADGP